MPELLKPWSTPSVLSETRAIQGDRWSLLWFIPSVFCYKELSKVQLHSKHSPAAHRPALSVLGCLPAKPPCPLLQSSLSLKVSLPSCALDTHGPQTAALYDTSWLLSVFSLYWESLLPRAPAHPGLEKLISLKTQFKSNFNCKAFPDLSVKNWPLSLLPTIPSNVHTYAWPFICLTNFPSRLRALWWQRWWCIYILAPIRLVDSKFSISLFYELSLTGCTEWLSIS